jgi:hypothetical protein
MEFERDPTTEDLERKPLIKLAKRVEELHIPINNTIGNWSLDKRYVAYHTTDDYEQINTAINNVVISGRLNEVPPPIIAIRKTAYGAPAIFFIRTNVPIYRKKKSSKPKPKRKKMCRCK